VIRRSFSGVAVAAALLLVSPLSAQQPLWTYQSPKDIEFRQLTPLGSLLLSTDGGLTALDPTSGRVLWQREDLGKVKEANFDVVPGSPFAVVSQGGVKGRFEVISLETGAKLWDSKALPIVFSQGMLAFPRDEMFFSVGNGGKTDYLGLDMKSGDVRWAQDKFFAKTPTVWPVKGSGGMVKRMSVEGHQGPLFDSDETAILWISEEGPARLNVKTGQKLWVATALKGFDAPATKTGFAEMQLENGVVYAPFEQKLAAFRAADGSMVWSKPAEFKSGIGQMDVTPQGIVVRGVYMKDDNGKVKGKPFIDVVDAATGASKWAKPFKDLQSATSYVILDDKIYIGADRELQEIDIATGTVRSLLKFKFAGNEEPYILQVKDGNFVLVSSQTVMNVSRSGTINFTSNHKAPGSSTFSKISSTLSVATANLISVSAAYDRSSRSGRPQKYQLYGNPTLSKRFKATKDADGFSYILTEVQNADGKGPGLVKVDKRTGTVAGSLVLNDKTPDYSLDEVDGVLFLQKDDKTIVGFKL